MRVAIDTTVNCRRQRQLSSSQLYAAAPWHFLYFFPLPHGHGSFLPTFGSSRRTVLSAASSPPTRGGCLLAGIPNGIGAAGCCACCGGPKGDGVSAVGSLRISGGRRGAGGRRTGAESSGSTSRSDQSDRTIS